MHTFGTRGIAEMKKILILLLFLLAPAIGLSQHIWDVPGNAVQVSWLANSELDLAYYKVYANDILIFATTDTTTTAITPILSRYYTKVTFHVTAVDTAGNESLPSSPVWAILCKDTLQLLGDVDKSGMVDAIDYASILWKGGTVVTEADTTLQRKDLDGSGNIDIIDLAILKAKAGAMRPPLLLQGEERCSLISQICRSFDILLRNLVML